MLTYNVHLKTISEFRIYANMSACFHIAGYVILHDEKINMYDILDIMENGPVEEMVLVLTKYRKEEIAEIEKYMEENKIINDKNQAEIKRSA